MTLSGSMLALLMARCAPNVAPTTMAAIVHVESGGDPFAIGDNTTRHSYHPRDAVRAQSLANRLLRQRHSIDVGLVQIDDLNFVRLGVDTRTVLDPCVNLSLGVRIISADYAVARRRYRDSQLALRHAIGMYNTGRLTGGSRYIALVVSAAGVHDTPSASHAARRSNVFQQRLFEKYHPTAARNHPQPLPERSPILAALQQRVP